MFVELLSLHKTAFGISIKSQEGGGEKAEACVFWFPRRCE